MRTHVLYHYMVGNIQSYLIWTVVHLSSGQPSCWLMNILSVSNISGKVIIHESVIRSLARNLRKNRLALDWSNGNFAGKIKHIQG